MSDLRIKSRQAYLQKREAEQLALLKIQVAEEEEESRRLGDRLSTRERADFEKNRQTLRLAEERNNIDEHLDGYILPDASNKSEALTRKHKEKGYEKSEVQLWEDEQTKRVQSQIKEPKRIQQDDYELVFDETQEVKFMRDGPPVDLDKYRLELTLNEAERKSKDIESVRKSLPIYKYKDEFLSAVEQHQAIVLVGETGSGKTTQTPQFLRDRGFCRGPDGERRMIACTQPRRVAAMSVAARVAEEVGVRLGNEVGYSVRFDDKSGPLTEIKYLTDGLMVRELLADGTLSQYSVIIIDEAHERSVASDLLLPIIKDLMLVRPDLKLIISSATVDAAHFSKYFGGIPIFSCPGRTYPVDLFYTESAESNYVSAAITTCLQIHITQPRGDILVFLCGQDEIDLMALNLEETAKKLGSRVQELIICPLYSALPSDIQAKAFEPTPPKSRKIVLATNLAETSITIDGIVYVIDNGLVKEDLFDPSTQIETLAITPCSKASANQRAGRAGRTQPGKCFRLYTRIAYWNELPASNLPSIQRVNLMPVCLTLKSLGVNNLLDFDFLDPPSPNQMIAALESLYALGALTQNGELTKMGRRMSEFPTDPMLAKAILAASDFGCVSEVLTIVAMLGEAGGLFSAVPRDKKIHANASRSRFVSKEGGDMLTYLAIYDAFVESEYDPGFAKEHYLQHRTLNRARDVREQLVGLCDRVEVEVSTSGSSDHVAIRKAITAGFFSKAARLQRDGLTYRTLRNAITTKIHPSSVLGETRPKFVIYHELVQTSADWMRAVMPIEPEWLYELAPHFHKSKDIEALGTSKKLSKGQGKVGIDR